MEDFIEDLKTLTSNYSDLNNPNSVNEEKEIQREESIFSVQNISFDNFNQKLCTFMGKASDSIDEFKIKMNKVIAASTVAKNTFQNSLQVQNENRECEERVKCQLKEGECESPPETVLDNIMQNAFKVGTYAVVYIEYAACKSKKVFYAAGEAREKFVKEYNKDDDYEDCKNLCPEIFGKPKIEPVNRKQTETATEPEKKEVEEASLEPPPAESKIDN